MSAELLSGNKPGKTDALNARHDVLPTLCVDVGFPIGPADVGR